MEQTKIIPEQHNEDRTPPGFVQESLLPVDIEDVHGIVRRIYSFGPSKEHKFMFKAVREGHVETGVEDIKIFDKSVEGVLRLAETLGVVSPNLDDARRELAEGHNGPAVHGMIDDLVALSFVRIPEEQLGAEDPISNAEPSEARATMDKARPDAEAIYLLSLMGEQSATSMLEAVRGVVAQVDDNAYREIVDSQSDAPELKKSTKDLVAVHATSYEPRRTKEGYEINSTFDGTEGQVLRNTIHFALNHRVESHMQGSWEESRYIVICPYEGIQETNGRPRNFYTIDTYWTVNPGEGLKLPGAVLVKPGDLAAGKLDNMDQFEVGTTHEVLYKAGDYTEEDLKALVSSEDYTEEDLARCAESTIANLLNSLSDAAKYSSIESGTSLDSGELSEHLWSGFGDDSEDLRRGLGSIWFGAEAEQSEIKKAEQYLDKLTKLLESYIEKLNPTLLAGRFENMALVSPEAWIRRNWEGALASMIRDKLADRVMIKLGYQVMRPGQYGWMPHDQEEALAFSINTEPGLVGGPTVIGQHNGNADYSFEKFFIDTYNNANSEDGFDFTQFRDNLGWNFFDISKQTRRILYASGYLSGSVSLPPPLSSSHLVEAVTR